jgi:hypothetical protein
MGFLELNSVAAPEKGWFMKKLAMTFCLAGLLAGAAYAQQGHPAPKKDDVNIVVKNPLKEDGVKPKRPFSGPEGPTIVFEGDGKSPTKVTPKADEKRPVTPTSPSYRSEGSYGSQSTSSSEKVTVKVTKEITKVTEVIEIDLQAKVVEVPKGCLACNPFKVKCAPIEGNCDYMRFSSGRTVVWFVVTPTKEDEPYTIYPPFNYRLIGNNPVAQEQDWLVEYVQERGGRKNTIWQNHIRVKPDPNFKPKGPVAVFDVTRPFEGAKIKAAKPFFLVCGVPGQAWWGTAVPGYQGRLEADVVAGNALMLRLPYSGQANFEGANLKALGPVIVEE